MHTYKPAYMHKRINGTSTPLSSLYRLFPKDDIMLKISLFQFIECRSCRLNKQDFSYSIQLIKDKTKIFEYIQSKKSLDK